MSLYKQLAEQIAGDIEDNKLQRGSRLPSLRQLAKQHAISMTTAVHCYQELESLGLIKAKPQTGYYVAEKSSSLPPPTWSQFASRITVPRASPITTHHHSGPLGVSGSALTDNEQTELERSFRRVMQRIGHRLSSYPNSQGEQGLRLALANHFSELGIACKEHDFVVTSGCMSAMKTALEVCSEQGDAVAISSPCFNGTLELLHVLKRKIVEIPSLEEGIDLDQLEEHLKCGRVKTGVFCTSHMNPQGITMSPKQKQRLARLANQYQVPIIEDDVYLELSYSAHCPLPAKYYDDGGYILWCGSVSKSLSPSYRLGWCIPGRFREQYHQHFAAGSYGVSTPVQLALADFIDSGQYAKLLKAKRRRLLEQREQYLTYLARHLPKGAKVSNPQGGFVVWVQIPSLNGRKLVDDLTKHRIDVRPGALFTTLDLYHDCLRINIGHPLKGGAKSELDKLLSVIKQNLAREMK